MIVDKQHTRHRVPKKAKLHCVCFTSAKSFGMFFDCHEGPTSIILVNMSQKIFNISNDNSFLDSESSPKQDCHFDKMRTFSKKKRMFNQKHEDVPPQKHEDSHPKNEDVHQKTWGCSTQKNKRIFHPTTNVDFPPTKKKYIYIYCQLLFSSNPLAGLKPSRCLL